jgi:thioredoxin 1
MKNAWKIIIVLILAASVVAVVVMKKAENQSEQLQTVVNNPQPVIVEPNQTAQPQRLPRLVDLGADKCIPCKMMAPILEELKSEYKDKLQVDFIDVWKNPQESPKYKIRVIPTQIFFDPDGKELFRHEGFFSKEDILAKWKGFGVNLEKGTSDEKN